MQPSTRKSSNAWAFAANTLEAAHIPPERGLFYYPYYPQQLIAED
jgi:hypothetical protein